MLPNYGPMSAGMIRGEFTGNIPMNLSSYTRNSPTGEGGGYVPGIPANVAVKTVADKMLFSHYYGASHYGIRVKLEAINAESNSEYGGNNDGSIYFRIDGSSPSYTVKYGGFNGTYTPGQQVQLAGLEGSNDTSYTMTITESQFSYSYTLYFKCGGGDSWCETGRTYWAGGAGYLSYRSVNRAVDVWFSLM